MPRVVGGAGSQGHTQQASDGEAASQEEGWGEHPEPKQVRGAAPEAAQCQVAEGHRGNGKAAASGVEENSPLSDQVPKGELLNFQASGEVAGQQGSVGAAGSSRKENGPPSGQVPKGAPLNLQGSGEVQKARQQSYAETVVKGTAMPKPRTVTAAQNRPVGATVATGQGGYMFHCTRQTEAECLERMLFGAPRGAI